MFKFKHLLLAASFVFPAGLYADYIHNLRGNIKSNIPIQGGFEFAHTSVGIHSIKNNYYTVQYTHTKTGASVINLKIYAQDCSCKFYIKPLTSGPTISGETIDCNGGHRLQCIPYGRGGAAPDFSADLGVLYK